MSPTGHDHGVWLIALAALSATLPFPAMAQRPVEVNVLSFALTCDPDQCRTPVLELHERTGIDESSIEYVFAPPAGTTLNDAHTTGVEVDGDGADHYVRALSAGANFLKCKWLAKARPGGANGFTKGYCWIGIKK
jgi:hypothetical protein